MAKWASKSKEEKADEQAAYVSKVAAFAERLAGMVDGAEQTEAVAAYLRFAATFHRYSFNNVVLIEEQCKQATLVAGYSDWQKRGRQVRKGERGIRIFAPRIGTTYYDGQGNRVANRSEAVRTERRVAGFLLVSVFDVSQTDGEPVPMQRPLWVEDSEAGGDLLAAVEAAATGSGLVVKRAELGAANGASYGGTIAVNASNSTLAQLSGMVHEWAHELLHRGEDRAELGHLVKEVEAEAVAYTVCSYYGFEVLAANYLALSGATGEDVKARLERICKAAHTIINAVDTVLGAASGADETEANEAA